MGFVNSGPGVSSDFPKSGFLAALHGIDISLVVTQTRRREYGSIRFNCNTLRRRPQSCRKVRWETVFVPERDGESVVSVVVCERVVV